jgi:hypothetical protein
MSGAASFAGQHGLAISLAYGLLVSLAGEIDGSLRLGSEPLYMRDAFFKSRPLKSAGMPYCALFRRRQYLGRDISLVVGVRAFSAMPFI